LRLGFGRRDIADGFKQVAVIEPVYLFPRGVFDILEGAPRALPGHAVSGRLWEASEQNGSTQLSGASLINVSLLPDRHFVGPSVVPEQRYQPG
jgi:hypothetical protein